MPSLSELVPVKLNLFLHVGRSSADGYNDLTNQIVFPAVGIAVSVSTKPVIPGRRGFAANPGSMSDRAQYEGVLRMETWIPDRRHPPSPRRRLRRDKAWRPKILVLQMAPRAGALANGAANIYVRAKKRT